eukprot:2082630-Prymnesium_polylepis.1
MPAPVASRSVLTVLASMVACIETSVRAWVEAKRCWTAPVESTTAEAGASSAQMVAKSMVRVKDEGGGARISDLNPRALPRKRHGTHFFGHEDTPTPPPEEHSDAGLATE